MNTEKNSGDLNARLTSSAFWDSCYDGRVPAPFDDQNWRNYVSIQLTRLVETLNLDQKEICEVGGGDGEMLAYFAKRHPSSKFSVIDFSPAGCELARNRASREGVSLDVHQADLFSPPKELLERFDLVISHGVVEHFTDLANTMSAKKSLLRDGGKIFTLIPNFASPVYAFLCKHWSKTVYEDHVPHTMRSFLEGHKNAGLKPLNNGYLGSMEFGMLSMAMHGPERKSSIDRQLYLWLTRLSKAVHLVEHKTVNLPATGLLSPFMYVVSTKTT
ncbi:MAG: class I SAM-dependent methyltransferase [Hydrogenophaga sp.]|uniref:class I SAM-dependent methyltransferase n=1 Tax=Hydrogenophaga sp. TaxID=1904254 RepID=UPI0025BBDDC6|nr:class I SAM-dependent methyltransferase [Hydrogenophaga sp.]MBT9550654.1 class I SAM-dependent methyltransferase [Hydrogenophaga sp.]